MNIAYEENTLTAEEYVTLERKMGVSETSFEQAKRSIENQLYSVTAKVNDAVIGTARLIGDAAIFWYINDVWVLPEYQGIGIGKTMVKMLIDYVKQNSLSGTSVSICLLCAKGKEGFYEKLGFLKRPHQWEGAGMEMELDID